MATWVYVACVVFGSGVVAGVFNRTIGSGHLACYLVLTVVVGTPPLVAQVAGQAAAPASFLTAWGKTRHHQATWPMRLAAMAGVGVGALVLTRIPPGVVAAWAPAGLAVGAGLLALAPLVGQWTTRHVRPLLFLAGCYGGTVGAGVGTIVQACVDGTREAAVATRNAVCLPMGLVVTGVLVAASPPWQAGGLVNWSLTLPLAGGMIVGGEVGDWLLRHALAHSPAAPAGLRAAVVSVSGAAAAGLVTHSAAAFAVALLMLASAYGIALLLADTHQPPSLGKVPTVKGVS